VIPLLHCVILRAPLSNGGRTMTEQTDVDHDPDVTSRRRFLREGGAAIKRAAAIFLKSDVDKTHHDRAVVDYRVASAHSTLGLFALKDALMVFWGLGALDYEVGREALRRREQASERLHLGAAM
jgi:hypothetical protein